MFCLFDFFVTVLKEEMICAMKEYVSQKFTDYLTLAIEAISGYNIERKILALGNAYVNFFMENVRWSRDWKNEISKLLK